jgi:hypothetical protein
MCQKIRCFCVVNNKFHISKSSCIRIFNFQGIKYYSLRLWIGAMIILFEHKNLP